MDDFVQLRRELYYNTDTTDFQSCSANNEVLFDAVIDGAFRDSSLYRASVTVKSLLDLAPPVPDLRTELSEHLNTVPAYDRFFQEYLLRLDGVPPPAFFKKNSPKRASNAAGQDHLRRFLSRDEEPIVLFQYLYHGDPARIGGGNSGGAAAFVRYLGNALARLPGISRVVTLVPAADEGSECILGEGHLLSRIPLGFHETDVSVYLQYQREIEEAVSRLLHGLPRRPDLVHLRFLDAASLSTARAAKKLSIPVVITLTPDPHRTMCGPTGSIRKVPLDEGLELLYRIYTGDQLARLANGIIGIGRQTVKNELIHYFPQLEDVQAYRLKSIDEGIPTEAEQEPVDPVRFFSQTGIPYAIHEEFVSLPVILNVGRLKPVKGQRSLVRAWGESKLREFFNLVLIGGDFENPDADEAGFAEFLTSFMESRPHLKGHLAHLPAQPNSIIRSLEQSLASSQPASFPNMYVCSSFKEEFGISILEAMAARMVVCAPLRGGASTYLRHSVNGFLIDTSDHESIASDITACILDGSLSKRQLEAIRSNAGETVHRSYSIEKISTYYRDFYQEVINETGR